MFHKSAAYYDAIYRELKDYADEAEKLDYLLGLFEPKPKRILDVGCGTGEHAMRLARDFGYQVDGIDIEPKFIEIAARKTPHGNFQVADMQDFQLRRKYDAILCLFTSIAYVETEVGLRNAFACMAKHIQQGGWLVCEPWARPENWADGQVDAIEAHDPATGETITRRRIGKRDGDVSVLKIEYSLSKESEKQSFEEVHRLGLFTQEQMTNALEAAGFKPRWAEHSLHGGPFVVATYAP